MKKKFYKGYVDGVYKAIFCSEENKDLLKWYISKSLNQDVEIVRIYSPEIIKPNVYVKGKTLDVIVKLKEKLVCIEINSCYYEGLHERNASYAFSKYSEQMKVGDRYTDMIPLIQINFTKGLPKDYPMVGEYTLSDLNTKINFIDNFKILEFNVIR